jgi:hypothetical protein
MVYFMVLREQINIVKIPWLGSVIFPIGNFKFFREDNLIQILTGL